MSHNRHPKRTTIHKDDMCELVLIEWAPGDIIPEHLHPGVNCYFSVLYGQLKETRCGVTNLLNQNESSYIDDNHGPHCVEATRKSVSIHFYLKTGFLSRL